MIARKHVDELLHLVDISRRDLSGKTRRKHNARIGELLNDLLDRYPDLNTALEGWIMNLDDGRTMWQVLDDELRSRGLR